jgi:hypothetical protein
MDLINVCPQPRLWFEIYTQLEQARIEKVTDGQNIPPPPIPLILNGWVFSSDVDKKYRWDETIEWAKEYGLDELIPNLKPDQFYQVYELSFLVLGPFGNPTYLPWNYSPRKKPDQESIQ